MGKRSSQQPQQAINKAWFLCRGLRCFPKQQDPLPSALEKAIVPSRMIKLFPSTSTFLLARWQIDRGWRRYLDALLQVSLCLLSVTRYDHATVT
jgi:hypothetical protein